MSQATYDSTIFGPRMRWAVRVLAWLAFVVASYLAWKAATGSAVAGCDVGGGAGCDVVLTSSWSKWLTLPVSLAGLACYAALAGFSALIGLTGPRESRWIDTLVVMLATLAAGASIWFLGLQIFVIGHFCKYCIVVDLCGIALGGLALWSVFRPPAASSATHISATSVVGLRRVAPNLVGVVPLQMGRPPARPALAAAFGGAAVLLAILIGGQVLWPSATHRLETVALDSPINMTSTGPDDPRPSAESSPTAQTHVAMRPVESNQDGDETSSGKAENAANDKQPDDKAADSNADERTENKRSRTVTFLGGKLTLDTYDYPIIGDPEAPHVMVELVSYDCPHCRKMHPVMQRGLKRYGNQLAVLILPVPLESKCNRLVTNPAASHPGACTIARMALAVAAIKPSAFRSFHEMLMQDEKTPPTQAQAVGRAYRMVDTLKLRKLTSGEVLNKKIEKIVDLYASLQQQHASNVNFGLPVQILGDEVMSGSVEKDDDVFKAWEKNLGVTPQ